MLIIEPQNTGVTSSSHVFKSCIIEFLEVEDLAKHSPFIEKFLRNRTDMDSYSEYIIGIEGCNKIKYLNKNAEFFFNLKQDEAIGLWSDNLAIHSLLSEVMKDGAQEYHLLNNDNGEAILARRVSVYSNDMDKASELSCLILLLNLTEFLKIVTESDLIKIMVALSKFKDLYQEYKFIFDQTDDLITITDGDGILLRVNSVAEKVFDQKEEQIIGKTMLELRRQGMVTDSVTLQVLKTKKKVTLTQDTVSGHRLVVTGTPIFDANNKIYRVLNVSKDITDIDNLKNRLREAEELFVEYEQKLQSLNNNNKLTWQGLVVSGLKMGETLRIAKQIMEVDSTVLILGESGVGKGVLARSIHSMSPRCSGPFIQVNCGAIVEALLESELFGYEKGSFTGALNSGKRGLAEAADKGILFLDEIGELSLGMQVKLLELIQHKTITPVGSTHSKKVDIRILAATNKNLREMVKLGKFREDLYYRINVVPITIPPLRERRDEIPMLINYYLNKFTNQYQRKRHISVETIEILVNYNWPGNIRELENVIERLVVISPHELITSQYFPEELLDHPTISEDLKVEVNRLIPLKEALEKAEEKLYDKAFELHSNHSLIAELLGVHRTTVIRKAKKYCK